MPPSGNDRRSWCASREGLLMAIRTEAGLPALRLSPAYRERVWGGRRLAPNAAGRAAPVGEAWLVHERNRVATGRQAGSTLAEVAAGLGEALLGRRAAARTGARFPLLIKLLDTADWLSLQVHPDDAQAARLEGPGQFGKTEAWHILEAAPGAELICGLRPGTTPDPLAADIRKGTIHEPAQRPAARAGDTL